MKADSQKSVQSRAGIEGHKLKDQAAVIALQEGQIKALTAGLKQQGRSNSEKSTAQLEMVRPTPRVGRETDKAY